MPISKSGNHIMQRHDNVGEAILDVLQSFAEVRERTRCDLKWKPIAAR
ncbi:MAG: hypothetical protein ACREBR_01245 [bacterium]